MKIPTLEPGQRRLAFWGLVLAGLSALYALAGFLAVPLAVKPVLVRELSRAMNRSVALEGVSYNPFTATLTLRGLLVPGAAPGQPLVAARTVLANAEVFPLLLRRAALSEVLVEDLRLFVRRERNGTFDFESLPLLAPGEEPPAPQPADKAGTPWAFRVQDLALRNATLVFNDTLAGAVHRVGNLTLSLPVLDSAPGAGRPGLVANLTAGVDGGFLELSARGDPLAANGTVAARLELRDLPLAQLSALAPLNFAGPRPTGSLDLNATANATLAAGDLARLSASLDLGLSNVTARDGQGRDAARLGRLGIREARFVLPENRLIVDGLEIMRPWLRPELTAQGLNLAALAAPAPDTPKAAPRRAAKQQPAAHGGQPGKSVSPGNDTANATMSPGTESGVPSQAVPDNASTVAKAQPAKTPSSRSAPEPAAARAFRAEIRRFRLAEGRVEFSDATVSPPVKAVVAPLEAEVTNLHLGGPEQFKAGLRLGLDGGGKFSFSGEGGLAPLALAGTLEASGLDLGRAVPYLAGLGFSALEGRAGAKVKVAADLSGPEPRVVLKDSELSLDALRARVRGDEADLARLDRLEAKGLNLDLAARRADLGSVLLKGGGYFLSRDARGQINAARLGGAADSGGQNSGAAAVPVPAATPAPVGSPEPAAASQLPSISSSSGPEKTPVSTAKPVRRKGKAPGKAPAKAKTPARWTSPAQTAPSGGEWSVSLAELRLEGQSLRFADRSATRPVDLGLDGVALRLTGLAWPPPPAAGDQPPVGLDLSFGQSGGQGRAKVSGRLGLNPVAASLDLDLPGLDLAPLAGYAPPTVRLNLARGRLGLSGHLDFSLPPERGPAVAWKGGVRLNRFLFTGPPGSAGPGGAKPLASWESLDIKGLQAGMNPDYFQVERVGLDRLYASVALTANRTLNLVDAVVPKEGKGGEAAAPAASPAGAGTAPAAASGDASGGASGAASPEPATSPEAGPATGPALAAKPRPRNVVVENLVVTNATVDFADQGFDPPIELRLDELHGRVQGLISREGAPADISLTGRAGGEAPLSVLGQGTLFGGELFLDLKMKADGLDLARMTAYSEKYLGQALRSGKLSLDLAYKVRNSTLDSQNRISLDNLAMGRKVQSPDAVDLPISLAIALLKGSDGVVDLDVPVRGDVSKPDFSIGKVVWETIARMFRKLILAPFSFLGLPFGQDKTGYIGFEPGALTLTPESAKNLDKLVSAVVDKPGVGIEVSGRVDPAADEEGARRLMLDRRLAELKLKDLLARGESVQRLDEIRLTPDERGSYLGRLYRETKGFFKPFSDEKTERELLEGLAVTEDGWRQYARARALAVRTHLTGAGRIPVKRVFLVEPDKVEAEPRDGVGASRAEVTLRY